MNLGRRLCIAIMFMIVFVGGCANVTEDNAKKGLDDARARAQVMDPLKSVVKALNLNPVFATFSYESCDDNGDPPFRGGSGGNFEPDGVTADELKKQVVDTMTAQGWASGAGPGRVLYGTSLHKDGLLSVVSITDESTQNPGVVNITLYGTCENYGDHKGSPGVTNIIDELKSS